MTTKSAIATLALLLASGATQADEIGIEGAAQGTTATPAFAELDANADGRISKDEAEISAGVKGAFANLDRNGDGAVSPEEYLRYTPG